MTEPIETPQPETETRQVDAVVVLAETFAVILSNLLELIPPYQVQEGDITTLSRLQKAQKQLHAGMHQFHALLAAMGSTIISGPPPDEPTPPPTSSGIILPGR